MLKKQVSWIMAMILTAAAVFPGAAAAQEEIADETQAAVTAEVQAPEIQEETEDEILSDVSEGQSLENSSEDLDLFEQSAVGAEQSQELTVEDISIIADDESEDSVSLAAEATGAKTGELSIPYQRGYITEGYKQLWPNPNITSYEDQKKKTFYLPLGKSITISPESGGSDYRYVIGKTPVGGNYQPGEVQYGNESVTITHDEETAAQWQEISVSYYYTKDGESHRASASVYFLNCDLLEEGDYTSIIWLSMLEDYFATTKLVRIVPEKDGTYVLDGSDSSPSSWEEGQYGVTLYDADWNQLGVFKNKNTGGIGMYKAQCELTGGQTYYLVIDQPSNSTFCYYPFHDLEWVVEGGFPEYFCMGQTYELKFKIVDKETGEEAVIHSNYEPYAPYYNDFAITNEAQNYFTASCDSFSETISIVAGEQRIGGIPFKIKALVQNYFEEPTWVEATFYITVEDHQWLMGRGEVIKEPTCSEAGEVQYKCGYCDATKTEELPVDSTNHKWVVSEVISQGSCVTDGETKYVCERCGETKIEKTKGTGHRMKGWKTVREATALVPSRRENTCEMCGYTIGYDWRTLDPSIKLTAKTLKMKKGQSTNKFRVVSMTYGDYVESVISEDSKIVTVSNVSRNGTFKLKAKKKGKTFVTVTLASGYMGTVRITVQGEKVKTAKVGGVSKKATLKRGQTLKLSPVITPVTSQDKVKYTSSNKKVATVSKKGVVKGKKPGKAKITISSGGKKKVVTVTVKN